MRNISLANITEAATASFAGLPDARQRELVVKLVAAVHAYAKEVQLTHEEWRGFIGFLHKVGAMSHDSRSEFGLLSDVTGLSRRETSAVPEPVLPSFFVDDASRQFECVIK